MKRDFWKYSTFILAALLIVGAIIFYESGSGTNSGGGTQSVGNVSLQAVPGIPIGNSPVLGDANAKVTIVEFSDFSCPFCGAASGKSEQYVNYMISKYPDWQPAVPGIIKDYVETGKAKLVYKYSMGHTGGHAAQLVGWCLNDQGLFWKFYDLAFANQDKVEDIAQMKSLASDLGADLTALQTCLDSGKYDKQFDEDTKIAQTSGFEGTPAFYVDNLKLPPGAISYSEIKQVIDAELARN